MQTTSKIRRMRDLPRESSRSEQSKRTSIDRRDARRLKGAR